MKIFKPSNTTHTLQIIPRKYVANAIMLLRYELKNQTETIELECSEVNGYLVADFEYPFVEGGSYEITVNHINGQLLYRGKAYATNSSDLENYKLTEPVQ